jgi:D-xylose reductase
MSDLNGLSLADNGYLPSIGLGLWKIPQEAAAALVVASLELGYRHLDSASDYGNECEVGQGIRLALQRGICTREQMWVTGKLWNTFHRPEHVRPAVERTLQDLRLDYLDLYLIHFPISLRFVPFDLRYPPGWIYDPEVEQPSMQPDSVPISETWQAMEDLVSAGLCQRIGISNFGVSLIRDLLSHASIKPAVLQVESHPYLVQEKLLRYCQSESIAFTAFSPLGAGSYIPLGMATSEDSVLGHPLIIDLSGKYNKTPAQIVLRWGIQRGTAVIPKTARIERLAENRQVFDFALSDQEMGEISRLDRGQRFNDPGVFCEKAFGCFFPIYE